jgi:hypothetical protein
MRATAVDEVRMELERAAEEIAKIERDLQAMQDRLPEYVEVLFSNRI